MLDVLFEGKVGESYPEDKLKNIYGEGEKRYKNEQPPGYKDIKKGVPGCYGDLIIWFQIIDQAKATKKSIIFITDDKKEDWWREHKGKTLGPHEELGQEINAKAGVRFYMYKPGQFMNYAQQYLNIKVENLEEAIEEIREVREALDQQADLLSQALRISTIPSEHLKAIEEVERLYIHSEQANAAMQLDSARAVARFSSIPSEQLNSIVQATAERLAEFDAMKMAFQSDAQRNAVDMLRRAVEPLSAHKAIQAAAERQPAIDAIRMALQSENAVSALTRALEPLSASQINAMNSLRQIAELAAATQENILNSLQFPAAMPSVQGILSQAVEKQGSDSEIKIDSEDK